MKYQRFGYQNIMTALSDTPVVMVVGPRQCGKTTLVKAVQQDCFSDRSGHRSIYLTLDEASLLDAALQDPSGFIRYLDADCIIIDEIQRAPQLLLAIKQRVDESRQPGQFLLTGSSQVMLLPQVADSLAGRIEVITLLPLTHCEIQNTPSTFFEQLLAGKPPKTLATHVRSELIQSIVHGGFPEAIKREDPKRQLSWYRQYIKSMAQKDMQDLARIAHLKSVPQLILALSHQVGCLSNYSALAGKIGLSAQAAERYLQLLEQLFLFQRLPAWHPNMAKRIVKTPKTHIIDTGLLCAIRGIDAEALHEGPNVLGHFTESYVLCELQRLASCLDQPLHFYHYRDKDKIEVDCVIETPGGQVIGIEVKSGATLQASDFKGLEKLKTLSGDDFLMGIVLYDGSITQRHQEQIFSVPLGALWC